MASCGFKGGDLVAFQMQHFGQDFVTACKSLGAWIDDPKDTSKPRVKPLPFNARDALETLAHDSFVVAIAASSLSVGATLSDADKSRLIESARVIRSITEQVLKNQ